MSISTLQRADELVRHCEHFSGLEAPRPHAELARPLASHQRRRPYTRAASCTATCITVVAPPITPPTPAPPRRQVHAEGGRIELSAERDKDDAVIRVRDNGTGIAPEMLPKVFELFTQVGRTLDRAQGGLGIGLALFQRLAEMHGGSITAESEGEGRGSTFVVRLPLARDPVVVRMAKA